MRLLVLGGTGFIGSHVVDQLLVAGHEVRVISRGPEPFRRPLSGVTYIRADYRQTESLRAAVSGCDAVLHLVSSTVPGTADRQPSQDVADNLIPLIDLMGLMLSEGVRRLVYLSSGGTVYGVPDEVPVPEGHPLRPINSYGIVKTAAESYVKLFSRTRGLSSIILRPSNPYGERQGREGTQGLINTLMHRALTGEPVEIWGDGSVVRDYLHVHDLARLCTLAVECQVVGVYNAGSGIGTSVREMINLVEKVSSRRIDARYGAGRAIDAPLSILDIAAARAAMDWFPRIKLEEGLAMTWQWHQAQETAG